MSKHPFVAIAALVAGAAAAVAAPVPLVSLAGPISSRGLIGHANNSVITFNTASVPPGTYSHLTVSGNLTPVASGTYASEACIEVTPPSGQKFIIKPFTQNGFSGVVNVPSGSVTVPVNGTFGPGQYTLRFFELYADNSAGADSNWSQVNVYLHSAADGPAPLDAIITPTEAGPDVSGGAYTVAAGQPHTVDLNHLTPRVVKQIRVRGFGTALAGYLSNNSVSQLGSLTVKLNARRADDEGYVQFSFQPFASSAASSSQCDLIIDAPYALKTGPGNHWHWEISDTMPVAPGTPAAQVWMSFQPLTPEAPGVTPVSVLREVGSFSSVAYGLVSESRITTAGNPPQTATHATQYSNVNGNIVTFDTFSAGYGVPNAGTATGHTRLRYVFNVPPSGGGGYTYQLSGHAVFFYSNGPTGVAELSFTGPGLNLIWPGGQNGSGAPFNFTGTFPSSGGQYTLDVDCTTPGEYAGGMDLGTHVSANGALVIMPPTPPNATALGTIRSRPALGPEETTPVRTQAVSLTSGAIKWYKFATEHACGNETGYWLDVHTRTAPGPVIDHEIGLYSDAGERIASDDDGGYLHDSMLTFGQTSPVRPVIDPLGANSARDGHDGGLDSGLYYLAVTQYNALFQPSGYAVTTNGMDTGDVNVEFRTNLPPFIPPFADLGVVRGPQTISPVVMTLPGQIKWFRFDTAAAIDNSTPYYLDIDTKGASAPAVLDTEIALFSGRGELIAADDDDGVTDNRSQLSFGAGTGVRPPIAGSLPGNGRDGGLPEGRYYLATGLFNCEFADEWTASSAAAGHGTYPVNFRTNLPPEPCGPADIGTTGGIAGADGVLNNNDFVVFIDRFFTGDMAADVGQTGGVPGADGALNNNDFIVFIDLFFAGCA